MVLLRHIEEDDEELQQTEYEMPAVIREDKGGINLKKALAISTAAHPLSVGLIWLTVFALALMGIKFSMFDRPKPKMNDIEFVLVEKEATPINKNTKYRSDRNSRSGGKNDPKRKVSMPSPPPSKVSKPSAASSSAQKMIQKQRQQLKQQAAQNKTQAKPQQTVAPKQQQKPQQTASQAPTPSPAKPAPPTVAPSFKPPAAPKTVEKPTTPFAVPVPPSLPEGKHFATGPVSGTGAPTGNPKIAGGYGGYAPTPSLVPGKPTGSGGGSSTGTYKGSGYGNGYSRSGSGVGGGTGNIGNPGGGGGAPGIDAIREPDFGPYMRELQRRIKLNWDPPKGNESKRVVLLFKIGKDGRMLSCRVFKSSGLQSADQAALRAVELTAPFRPLPADFKGQSIDIQFTFDYNVFNASRRY